MHTSNNRVVAFIHTYAQDGEFGSFFLELINGFVNSGVELHLVKINDLVDNLGKKRLGHDIDERKIVNYINEIQPAFLFTTNHGGVTKTIMQNIACPIVTWMVDRIPFLHHGGGHHDAFCEKDHLVTSSSKNVARLETIYPVLKGRVHYLPFATTVADFKQGAPVQDLDISFVGTYFYCGLLTTILETYRNKPEINYNLLKLSQNIKDNYDLDVEPYIERYRLHRVLKDFDLDSYRLKGLLANAISLNDRIKYLNAVADLGLTFWGTENWSLVNQFSLDLLQCFRFNEFIKTRSQLVDVYQRSKISINIPHHQAQDGLPYRIFDIMGSRALLITNHRENSDLFKLFGKDMPVPMYRDERDLRKKVRHFLDHEADRRAIVEQCNRLVEKGFAFEDRVTSFFEIVNRRLDSGSEGTLINVPRQAFKRSLKSRLRSFHGGSGRPGRAGGASTDKIAAPAEGEDHKPGNVSLSSMARSVSVLARESVQRQLSAASRKIPPSTKMLIVRCVRDATPYFLRDRIWNMYQSLKKIAFPQR